MNENPWSWVLSTVAVGLLIVIVMIGGMEYTFYLKRERDYNYQQQSCEAFKKQHPEEEVFYGREVGCKVKHNGYWSRL